MVKFQAKAKSAFKRVLKPVEEFVDTINGQKVLDDFSAYMTENEAISTALVTRLLHAETRIRVLQALIGIFVILEVVHWVVLR